MKLGHILSLPNVWAPAAGTTQPGLADPRLSSLGAARSALLPPQSSTHACPPEGGAVPCCRLPSVEEGGPSACSPPRLPLLWPSAFYVHACANPQFHSCSASPRAPRAFLKQPHPLPSRRQPLLCTHCPLPHSRRRTPRKPKKSVVKNGFSLSPPRHPFPFLHSCPFHTRAKEGLTLCAPQGTAPAPGIRSPPRPRVSLTPRQQSTGGQAPGTHGGVGQGRGALHVRPGRPRRAQGPGHCARGRAGGQVRLGWGAGPRSGPSLAGQHVPDRAHHRRPALLHHLQLRDHHVDHGHARQQRGQRHRPGGHRGSGRGPWGCRARRTPTPPELCRGQRGRGEGGWGLQASHSQNHRNTPCQRHLGSDHSAGPTGSAAGGQSSVCTSGVACPAHGPRQSGWQTVRVWREKSRASPRAGCSFPM